MAQGRLLAYSRYSGGGTGDIMTTHSSSGERKETTGPIDRTIGLPIISSLGRTHTVDNPIMIDVKDVLANPPRGTLSFVEISLEYDQIVRNATSPQMLTDKTLEFLKKLFRSECGCLRTVRDGEPRIVYASCRLARTEKRVYKVDERTIISAAARLGIAVLEGDQRIG